MNEALMQLQESIYSVQLENASQVADMLEFWQERVVAYDSDQYTVDIKTDAQAFDEFMMFFDLYCVQKYGD